MTHFAEPPPSPSRQVSDSRVPSGVHGAYLPNPLLPPQRPVRGPTTPLLWAASSYGEGPGVARLALTCSVLL